MHVYRHPFTKITFAIGVKVISIKRVLGCLFVVCSLVCFLFVCFFIAPAPMAQWLCHRLWAGRYWVRISVPAPTQSGFLRPKG